MRTGYAHTAAALGAVVLICILSTSAAAFWLMDGNALCTDPAGQVLYRCAPDGSGGLIALWRDERYYTTVAAQRIDSTGAAVWEKDGRILMYTRNQLYPSLVPTGTGEAIAVWRDDGWDRQSPSDTMYVVAHHTLGWSNDHRFVCTASTYQTQPVSASDGSGGVIVAWLDDRGGAGDSELYVQRLAGADGSLIWTAAGVPACSDSGPKGSPRIIADGSGGAIVAWIDYRNGNPDIYAQRLDHSGAALWAAGGVRVCDNTSSQHSYDIIADGDGGALFAWVDTRNGNNDIFAQHISPAGSANWGSAGAAVCTADDSQGGPVIAPDGKGGATIAWIDERDYDVSRSDIYAQRLGSSGSPLWTIDGIAVCDGPGEQFGLSMASTAAYDCYIAWLDDRGDDVDIRAQYLTRNGTLPWPTDGVLLCSSDGNNYPPRLVPDTAGGVIAAWTDQRDGNLDIYAARLFPDGTMGWEPSLDGAADLPGDEGGWVRLSVSAPSHDNRGVTYLPVTGYNIWRRVDAAGPLGVPAAAARLYGPPPAVLFEEASNPGDILRAPAAIEYDFPPGDWESIGYSAARQIPSYLFAVPTRSDSTGSGIPREHFVVTIHTSDPGYYFIVGPDSAYSVDNLPPAQPQGLAGEALDGPPGIELSWSANTEGDLSYYSVYRGSFELFMPGRSTHLGTTAVPSFADKYADWHTCWYKVAAIDRHGNMSVLAVLGPDGMVTGDETPEAPADWSLYQNVPNPFNPSTTIRFDMPAAARVRLSIYSVSGERIATLSDGPMPAGRREVVWDGRDETGRQVASGIYFYRLDAGEFTKTRKMVLLK